MSANETVLHNNKFNTYLKCITLIYREIKLNKDVKNPDYSIELVKELAGFYTDDSQPILGTKALLADSLQELCTNIVNNIEGYSEDDIIDSLSLLLKDDKNTLTSVLTNLQKEMNNSALKRSVVSLRIQLIQYTKEVTIKKKLAKAYYDTNVNKSISILDYTKNLVMELDLLTSSSGESIPGIVNEIDIEDSSMVNAINAAKDMLDGTSKLQTGFREMNTMLQGKLAPYSRNTLRKDA